MFFASGPSYCSVFTRFIYFFIPVSGLLWTFGRMPTYSQFSPSSLVGQQFGAVGVAGSSLTSFGTEASSSSALSQSSAVGSAFTQDSRALKTQLSQGRSSPQLDPLRKSPTMEQAVQTASAHLPAPAPVGRRSPVSTRPLPSTSQKPIENQEHRRAEVHKVSRPENEQLRNDSKRQIVPGAPSAPRRGRGVIEVAEEDLVFDEMVQ